MAQFISNVGAGTQTGYGSSQIGNVAQGFIAGALLSLAIGQPLASDDTPARLVEFNFTETSEYTHRLDFDPSRRPVALLGQDLTLYGAVEVENSAQGFLFDGFETLTIPGPVVSDDRLARNVQFAFTVVQEAELALHFNFGGAYVLAASGLDSLTFSANDIEGVAAAFPQGWDSLRAPLSLISYDLLSRNIEFDLTVVQEGLLALHLPFGGAPVVPAPSIESLRIGEAEVDNVAEGAFVSGFEAASVGNPVVSYDVAARSIVFNFTVVSEIPPGNSIQLGFGGDTRTARFDLPFDSFTAGTQYIWKYPYVDGAGGFESAEFGTDHNFIWLPYPVGFESLEFGLNGIHFPGYILGHGFDSLEIGTIDVPRVVVKGLYSFEISQHLVEKTIPPEDQLVDFEEFAEASSRFSEEAFVSNYWRVYENVGGIDGTQWSSGQRVSHSPQLVWMPFDNRFLEMGEPPIIGYEVGLVMSPHPEHTEWGLAVVRHAMIYPEAFAQTTFAKPEIRNLARVIAVPATETIMGTPSLNFPQYIDLYHDCELAAARCGSEFSDYNEVLNVNQAIYAYGWPSLRMEWFPARIGRAGRALELVGLNALQFNQNYWENLHLVAHGIRYYTIGGLDSLIFTDWSRIKNAARVLYPQGFESEVRWGDAFVDRMRETLFFWGRSSLEISSQAWASHAPITTHVEYSIRSIAFGDVFVAEGVRPIAPEGVETTEFGRWDYDTKPVPTLTPRWWPIYEQDENLLGLPGIRNFNPQTWPVGLGSLKMPALAAWVSHSPRNLTPPPVTMTIFGRQVVEFRDKAYDMEGFQDTEFSPDAHVWNDPPITYFPFPQFPQMSGINSLKLGQWEFVDSVIRMGDMELTDYGSTLVYANGILFENEHNQFWGWTAYGNAQVIGPQYVDFTIEAGDQDGDRNHHLVVPKIRISPHTIWCRNDTPPKAIDNHDGIRWCDVDKFCPPAVHPFHNPYLNSNYPNDPEGPWWGWTLAANKGTQVCAVWHWHPNDKPEWKNRLFTEYGEASVTFGTNVLAPLSIDSFRQGYPIVLTAGDHVVLFREDYGIVGLEFSEDALVSDNGPRYVDPLGLNSLVVPWPWPENLHREVYMGGADQTEFGGDATPPMVYFYPRGPVMVGTDTSEFGLQWASHSPRWLDPIGFDSFSTRWTDFDGLWMVDHERQFVKMYGWNDFGAFGEATLTTGPMRIAPYGIRYRCRPSRPEITNV